MADAFNKITQGLKEAYAELEKKLEDRTRELEELNNRISELSVTDELTKVYNYRFFLGRLDEELQRSRRYSHRLSVIVVVLYQFKAYTDTHGRREADGLLQSVASCLKKSLRLQDVLARCEGGFTVMLPETDKGGALLAAERIRDSFIEGLFPDKAKPPEGTPDIGLGLASFPEDAEDPESLIQKASFSIPLAGEKGKNRVDSLII